MYATPRMLRVLICCFGARRIVVPFDRSILTVQKIRLFVNCVSAKPVQTPILVQSPFCLQLQLVLLLLLLLLLVQRVLPLPLLPLLRLLQ